MKKVIILALVLFVAVGSALAVDFKHSVTASLGLTPAVGYELDVDRFGFNFELLTIGARASAYYDVIPSEKHDLDLGVSVGYIDNPIMILVSALMGGIPLDFDVNVRYSFNFNQNNGIFIKAGMPLASFNVGSDNKFYIGGKNNDLEYLATMGLVTDVSIGYKHTF